MTKKRLRYSELGAADAEASAKPAVEAEQAVSAPVPAAEPAQAAPTPAEPVLATPVPAESRPPAAAPAMVPPRPKRNSTPVELARALAAARAAEIADGSRPAAELSEPLDVAYRTMRERTRARAGIAELLMFHVGGERYAVELLAVDEVIDLPVIHHVPEMPPAMLGVVTVRGSLTPVYSPQSALGQTLALRDAVLIFRRGGSRVGVLIDDVEDAISLDFRELRDAPGAADADTVILAVVRHADALVSIVDADALIAACQTAALLEIA